jgi:type II secretory pathway component PulF
VIGRIQRLSLTERVCRTLGLLLDAGVALPDALSTAAHASHHVWIEDRLERARDRIVAGDDVVVVLAETGLFTSAVHQILAVGERVGRLAPQMDVAAELIGTELDRRLQRVATLAEPVLVVVVGLIVAGVAISLVSSIYGVVGEL